MFVLCKYSSSNKTQYIQFIFDHLNNVRVNFYCKIISNQIIVSMHNLYRNDVRKRYSYPIS